MRAFGEPRAFVGKLGTEYLAIRGIRFGSELAGVGILTNELLIVTSNPALRWHRLPANRQALVDGHQRGGPLGARLGQSVARSAP
jgi:hypothetical protein